MSDVERIGGWGRGFNLVGDLMLLALVLGYGIASAVALSTGPASAVSIVVGSTAWAVGACFAFLLHRLNRCGVRLENGKVAVVNPRGDVNVRVEDVREVGRTRLGTERLLLNDGTSIKVWGVWWWTALNNALIREGMKELEWRLTKDRGSGGDQIHERDMPAGEIGAAARGGRGAAKAR